MTVARHDEDGQVTRHHTAYHYYAFDFASATRLYAAFMLPLPLFFAMLIFRHTPGCHHAMLFRLLMLMLPYATCHICHAIAMLPMPLSPLLLFIFAAEFSLPPPLPTPPPFDALPPAFR